SEVHGAQVRVAGVDANVVRAYSEYFSNDGGQNIVRSLPDFRCACKKRDAATAVEFQLNPGVRHLIPVDREARSRQVAGAGETNAASLRELPKLFFPSRHCHDAPDALFQPDGPQLQEIC